MQSRSASVRERNDQRMVEGSSTSQAAVPIEISVKQEVDFIPLFRGNTEDSDFDDGASVTLLQWLKSLK